ncbi:MAG: S1 RNA-binding domain-containing protein [Chloroflexi bacterium]|nr:S1 RNA-binding domain-containing protein [Chloroflexota bacterium]
MYKSSEFPWQPDESYWEALMSQGEFAHPASSPLPSERPKTSPPRLSPSRSRSRDLPWQQGNPEDWDRAEDDMRNHRILNLPVNGCNKGGVLVAYYSIQGFVPTSHMLNLPRLPDIEERLRVLSEKIGQILRLRIIEIDRERGRLILSERAALEDERALRLWQTIQPGDILEGTVTRLAPYGAFVDIGGVEGLVHISELSWSRVENTADVVRPGDKVRVYVLGLKPTQRKIALSIKRLQPDPWEGVEERYHVGDELEGTVTHVVHFGIFVRVEEGLEGLIHVSDLSVRGWPAPQEVAQEGDRVRVRVKEVNGKSRRLALVLEEVQTPS